MTDAEAEAPQPPDEGEAISELGRLLKPYSQEGRARIIRWAAEFNKVALSPGQPPRPAGPKGGAPPAGHSLHVDPPEFANIGELFETANPTSEDGRVLVAVYWFQEHEKHDTVGSQIVNAALKNLGYGVDNITRVFDRLIGTKPQLVRQHAKHGKSKQARKEYAITGAGRKSVADMISRGGEAAESDEG
jgi:hypothetical protein